MPTLARRQDGVYIVRHWYQDFATWQITSDGVAYLRRRGIEEDGYFSTDWFMHLWMNAWVYTGMLPVPHPWPVVVGDRDVPQGLRDAIHAFHAALRNADVDAAWSFVCKFGVSEFDDVLRELIRLNIGGSDRPHVYSWQLRDIRTITEAVNWIVTVTATVDRGDGPARTSFDFDERWVYSNTSWSVIWTGLPEAEHAVPASATHRRA